VQPAGRIKTEPLRCHRRHGHSRKSSPRGNGGFPCIPSKHDARDLVSIRRLPLSLQRAGGFVMPRQSPAPRAYGKRPALPFACRPAAPTRLPADWAVLMPAVSSSTESPMTQTTTNPAAGRATRWLVATILVAATAAIGWFSWRRARPMPRPGAVTELAIATVAKTDPNLVIF